TLIGKQSHHSCVRMLIGPPSHHHIGCAAGAAHVERVLLVQRSGAALRVRGSYPMHLVEATVIDVLRHKAISQTAQHTLSIGLSENHAALGINADQVQLGKEMPQVPGGATCRAAGSHSCYEAVDTAQRL